MKKAKVVLLITNILTPYRIPLFNELNTQFQKKGLVFKVVFASFSYPLRKWDVDISHCKFSYKILYSKKITLDEERNIFTYSGLHKIIRKENPIIIITSGFSFATLKIWLRSWIYPTPYIIWSGCINNKKKSEFILRKLQRKILISKASGFVTYGKLAREYLISLGANPRNVEIGINTVDTQCFLEETEKIRENMKGKERKVLLSIGYFVERKRLDLLFHIVKALTKERSDFVLKLVGEGPELQNLKKLAGVLDINDFVSFEGHKQASEIANYFAEAECFLFPTGFDIWGLVLVEAMAAGLPCIASKNAGAAYDLVQNGENGFVADFNNTDEVAEKIDFLLNDMELLKNIGERAKNFIEKNCTIEKSANGFVTAVLKSLS